MMLVTICFISDHNNGLSPWTAEEVGTEKQSDQSGFTNQCFAVLDKQ